MRGQYTIEEQAEQLKEYLGCPCTYFPPMADDQPIMAAYRQAMTGPVAHADVNVNSVSLLIETLVEHQHSKGLKFK